MTNKYILEVKTQKGSIKVRRNGLLGMLITNFKLIMLVLSVSVLFTMVMIKSTATLEECIQENSHLTNSQIRTMCTMD